MPVPIAAVLTGAFTLIDLYQKSKAAGNTEVSDADMDAALDGMAASDDRLSAAIARAEGVA